MQTAVAEYLRTETPASLLECSREPWPELEPLCQELGISLAKATPEEVVAGKATAADLALVHQALEPLSRDQGQQLLGCLRNGLTGHIWLLVNRDSPWPLASLISLGFRRDDPQPAISATLTSYTYDIATYNHKRTWNNARHWANPQNFHKYRW